jgi:hypothetical protein
VGPKNQSGRVQKISPPPGFDPRTVRAVASHYTDEPIAAYVFVVECQFYDEECHRFHLQGMLYSIAIGDDFTVS